MQGAGLSRGTEAGQTTEARECVCRLSYSVMSDSATPWTVASQAPLSMEFSRQGYWSELPCAYPGDLPNPGIELTSLMSPVPAGGFFTTSTTWETHVANTHNLTWVSLKVHLQVTFQALQVSVIL